MSPLWQFKAVSVFLYSNLSHAPASQPFLILHFVAKRLCSRLFFITSSGAILRPVRWRIAAFLSAVVPRAHLTLKISPKATARMAQRRTDTRKQTRHRTQQLLEEPFSSPSSRDEKFDACGPNGRFRRRSLTNLNVASRPRELQNEAKESSRLFLNSSLAD